MLVVLLRCTDNDYMHEHYFNTFFRIGVQLKFDHLNTKSVLLNNFHLICRNWLCLSRSALRILDASISHIPQYYNLAAGIQTSSCQISKTISKNKSMHSFINKCCESHLKLITYGFTLVHKT